jgi:hypothetical protein
MDYLLYSIISTKNYKSVQAVNNKKLKEISVLHANINVIIKTVRSEKER